MIIWLFAMQVFAVDSWSTYWHNNRGARALSKEDTLTATSELQKGLATNSGGTESSLHYNLGLTFEMQKDLENATREYLMASKFASDPEIKFQSEFNAARALGEQKKVAEALQHYQNALQIHPDSQEVKTNIELLLQQGGGGGGEGDNKSNSDSGDNKDDKQKSGNDQKQKPNGPDQTKPQKKQFKSQSMSEADVGRILNELKRQEEKIRGKELNKHPAKDPTNGKDW